MKKNNQEIKDMGNIHRVYWQRYLSSHDGRASLHLCPSFPIESNLESSPRSGSPFTKFSKLQALPSDQDQVFESDDLPPIWKRGPRII